MEEEDYVLGLINIIMQPNPQIITFAIILEPLGEYRAPTTGKKRTDISPVSDGAIQLVCPYIIHSTHEQTSTV